MEIKGMITTVLPAREGETANGHWKVQEFVVEHGSISYPRKAAFSMRNNKLEEFGHLLVRGKRVAVSFDIDAREYQGKWYNSVNAYRLEEIGAKDDQAVTEADGQNAQPAAGDDLPFG